MREKWIFVHILVVTTLFINTFISKGSDTYNFSVFKPENNFPSRVNCVFPEDFGCLWIGASDGVYKYDGYLCFKYIFDYEDASSNNFEIEHIGGDSDEYIWFAGGNQLIVYNKVQGTLNKIPVRCLCIKKCAGGFFFATKDSLYRYDLRSGTYDNIISFSEGDFRVFDMYELPDEKIMCSGHWRGIHIVDPDNHSFTSAFNMEEEHINAFYLDSHNRIWVGLYNKGIYCFGLDGELKAHYSSSNSKLSSDIVLSILEKNGNIWLATDGGGLNIISPMTGEIEVMKSRVGDSNSIPYNSILSITQDSFGNVWAIRVRGGLFSIRESSSCTYRAVPAEKYGLSANTVLCLAEDERLNGIWIGTDGGGVNYFDQVNNTFKWFDTTFGMKVVDIIEYSDSKLLISSFSEGLFLFDKKNGKLSNFQDKDNPLSFQLIYSGNSVNLQTEPSGNILFLSRPVLRYEPHSGRWSQIENTDNLSCQPISVKNYTGDKSLFYDKNHIYAVFYDDTTAKIIFETCSDERIRNVSSSDYGLLWISTDDGIYTFDLNTATLNNISTDSFNSARSVVADGDFAWIATETSIYRYNSASSSLSKYIPFQDIAPSEHHPRSCLVSSFGFVCFGGMDGLIVIDKNAPSPVEKNVDFVISDIFIDNTRLSNICIGNEIKVKSSSRIIDIDVFDKSSDLFTHQEFLFRVNGNDAVKQSTPHYTLRNLYYGKYQIDVASISELGEQSEWTRVLNINFPLPWYKSRLFLAHLQFSV